MPAIWLPDPRVRCERELARFRLHLVKHRSMLKNRIHSTLISLEGPRHPYVPLLLSAPGIGWVLAFTIAAEIGRSSALPRPRSSLAIPAFARASTSPVSLIAAVR